MRRSALVPATVAWLGLALVTAMAGCVEERTDRGGPTHVGRHPPATVGFDRVERELTDACATLRAGGFEGTYMFRRTNHSQNYRCEESGSLQPIRIREFRRARCACPRRQ